MTKFGNLAKAADQNRRVLDLYDAYLTSRRDVRAEADMLHRVMTKNLDLEDSSGERDRQGYWSASASGRCMRDQQFTFLGFPAKAVGVDSQNIFDNGDFLHLRYQVAGMLGGWLSDVEVPMVYQNRVRGTCDGILVWGEILELKSINKWGFDNVIEFGPKKQHKFQATAYMLAKKASVTRFVYENKDRNTNAEFVFELSDEYTAQVLGQWNEMDRLNAERQLAPRLDDCKNERGTEYKYCPFNHICAKAEFPSRKLVLV